MQIYDSDIKSTPVIFQIREIFENFGLLKLLVARDLTVRYKRSLIGIWWSLLNPLITTAILYYVFNTVFKSRLPDGSSFLPYLLSGVVFMTLFNQSLNMAADSIAYGGGILNKIYVRPEIFAFSAVCANIVNFLFGLIPLTLILFISHKTPTVKFPFVILVAICMALFAFGLSLILAICYINFDDSRSLINIFLMALQYITPVFYPISALGPHTQRIIKLNPLTSYLEIFRDVFGGNSKSTFSEWIIMFSSSIVMMIFGLYFFQKFWPKAVAKL